MRRALLVQVAAFLGFGIGCTDGGLAPGGVTQTVDSMGASITVSAEGAANLAGTTLLIPAGALSVPTAITVTRGDEQAATGETSIGPSVRFLPSGLTFAQPVTLTLPFKAALRPAGASLIVEVNSAGVKSKISGGSLAVDSVAQTVTVDIEHFTDYEVVAGPGSTDGGTDGGHTDGGTDGGHTDGGTDGFFDGGTDAGPADLGPPRG